MSTALRTTLLLGFSLMLVGAAWAQGTGAIFVTSDPSGMDAYVDGRKVGTTPVTVQDLGPGKYRVEIRSDNFADVAQDEVEVVARALTPVAFKLTSAQGGVLLRSDLNGLKIVLDGEEVGAVSAESPFSRRDLSVGAHKVDLAGPWFTVTRSFAVTKDQVTEVSLAADQHVGSVLVSSDIETKGARLDGIPIPGAPPYTVDNVAAGEHELVVELEPVPYREIITVRTGKSTSLDLRGGEHLGEIVVSADVTAIEMRVRIDGVLVSDKVPTKLQGVVAGGHIIEVSGIRRDDAVPVSGQKLAVLQPGGAAFVTFAEDELMPDRPECPEGMAWVPWGPTDGEFDFSMPNDEATPRSISADGTGGWVADRSWNPTATDRYGRRSPYEFEVGGTRYTLSNAASIRATHDTPATEAKAVNTDSALLIGSGSGAGGGGMGGPGMMGPGMMGGGGGGSGGAPGVMGAGGPGGSGGAPGMMGPGMMGAGGPGGAPGMMGGGGAAGAGAAAGQITAYEYDTQNKVWKRKDRPLDGTFQNYIIRWGTHTGHHFCIDKYEYPNFPGTVPIMATYEEAERICGQQDKRLCSSTEWVRACSGAKMSLFPYGGKYDPSKCNTSDNPLSHGLAPSGSFSECVSPYGAYDMSGNLAEWVIADPTFGSLGASGDMGEMLRSANLLYDTSHYDPTTAERSSSPTFDTRGGSWLAHGTDASCGAFNVRGVDSSVSAAATGGGARGFRCCTFADFDPEVERMMTRRHLTQ